MNHFLNKNKYFNQNHLHFLILKLCRINNAIDIKISQLVEMTDYDLWCITFTWDRYWHYFYCIAITYSQLNHCEIGCALWLTAAKLNIQFSLNSGKTKSNSSTSNLRHAPNFIIENSEQYINMNPPRLYRKIDNSKQSRVKILKTTIGVAFSHATIEFHEPRPRWGI